MSLDLKEIVTKTEKINQDFSEALEILKNLFENGITPSEESIKKVIDEVLSKKAFIEEDELEEKLKDSNFKAPSKEELKTMIKEIIEDLNLNQKINFSSKPPTALTKANVNDLIIRYDGSKKQIWLCIEKDEQNLTKWINLLGDEVSSNLEKKSLLLSIEQKRAVSMVAV
ncbi:hypothetical protein [Campylobacter taeniopygiae]|uniref:hypothetical protein n=1 Tax=Campylobacter taeniopygiae TaxID=2510188 RepID=UPI003D6BBA00